MSSFESKLQAYKDNQLNKYLEETDGDDVVPEVSFTVEVRKTSKFPARTYSDFIQDEVSSGKDVAELLSYVASNLWKERHMTIKASPVTQKRYFVCDARRPNKPYMRYSESMDFAMAVYGEFTVKLKKVSTCG